MLITPEKIEEKGVIVDYVKENVKHSTYDFTIGKIIPPGETDLNDRSNNLTSFYLEPNHIVYVVSAQSLAMDGSTTALASLVTTLTKQGILCLNTGVIDPYYRGPLGATLVNFSNKPRRISIGDRMFRVTFFEHDQVQRHEDASDSDDTTQHISERYFKESKHVYRFEFSETFLDVKNIKKAITNDLYSLLFSVFTQYILPWIALAAAIVAIFWEKS